MRAEDDKVVLIVDGKAVLKLKWDDMQRVHKGLYIKIKQAEEYANANQIIADHALLTRAGFPVGLTNRQDMQAEVAKEAAWNRDLRRAIRPLQGVASSEVHGTPSVIRQSDIDALPLPQRMAYLRRRYPNMKFEERN